MWTPLLAVFTAATLLYSCVVAKDQTLPLRGRPLASVPRPRLRSLSMGQLDRVVTALASLLETHPTENGRTRTVSRFSAPTLKSRNTLCRRHTQLYWSQIIRRNPDLWAVEMLDSTGKLPDGILSGNVNAFGAWDECLSAEARLNSSLYPELPPEGLVFRGRYAPVTVLVKKRNSPWEELVSKIDDGGDIVMPTVGGSVGVIGLCVPSTCSSEDVREGLQSLLGSKLSVHVGPSTATTDSVTMTWSDIFVIVVMSLVGVLMLIGTAVDWFRRDLVERMATDLQMTSVVSSVNDKLKSMMCISGTHPTAMKPRRPPTLATSLQVLVAFSVFTNVQKLLDTRQSQGSLSCLHGIRFISMTWVVLGHFFGYIAYYDANPMIALDWFKSPWFQVVANATPSVDTFFLLSGLLISYVFCAAYEKTRRVRLVAFYAHRWMRLTPPLAIMVGITATWYTHLGSGPIWETAGPVNQQQCTKYGWYVLLYINNYFEEAWDCLIQSWYLAVDMQLYVFSPIVLLPLVWKPRLGQVWLGLLTVAFLILRVVTWAVEDLPPTILALNPGPHVEEMSFNYAYPWSRAPVWLLGIGLGYILHRLRGKEITLSPWLVTTAWLAAAGTGLSVIYGMCNYQFPWQHYSRGVAVAYGGLHRFAWGVAVCWVIFACVTGYGGWVNTFLSYRAFIPLSRLTYSCYLVHVNVIQFADFSTKGPQYVDVCRLVYRYLAHLITSLAIAVPFSLAFEAPFIKLGRMALAPTKPKRDI